MVEENNNVPKGKSCFYHAEERKSRARVYCESVRVEIMFRLRVRAWPSWRKGRNFWRKRECVSIALELSITPAIAGVGQHVRNVVKSTIHTSVPRKINSWRPPPPTVTKNVWFTPKLPDAHFQGVHMEDSDSKPHLPVHLILGASEYAAVKRC